MDTIRKDLNEIRKLPEGDIYLDKYPVVSSKPAMYKVGEYVHYKPDEPEDALGYKEKDKRFREMDNRAAKFPKKIVKVLPYPAGTRYVLEGLPNVCYSENEQRLSKDQSLDKKVV